MIALNSSPDRFSAIAQDDWILVVTATGEFVRAGQVLRLRTSVNSTIVYFARLLAIDKPGLFSSGI